MMSGCRAEARGFKVIIIMIRAVVLVVLLFILLIISSSGSGDKNNVNDTKKNNDIDGPQVFASCVFLCQSRGGPQKDPGHVLTMAKLRSSISA